MKIIKILTFLLLITVFLSCSKKQDAEKNKDTSISKTNTVPGESIILDGKNITFRNTEEQFLKENPEYKLCVDKSEIRDMKIYCKEIDTTDATGNELHFKIYLKFFNNKLFAMNIDERWMPDKYTNIIEELVKEFKTVREEKNEGQGWFRYELEKGALKGNYIADSHGSLFYCYDEEISKEVKQIYPGWKAGN